MASAPKKRINPKFIELCKAYLDAIDAKLVSIELGSRHPDLWHVNMDLECIAGKTHDIPELQARVEQLGIRYAKVAFAPATKLPKKYLRTPKILPSVRPDQAASPMTDDEMARMIATLHEDGFPTELLDQDLARAITRIYINRRCFYPEQLRRGLATGLISGKPATCLDALLQTLLIAMSGTDITTFDVKQVAQALADAFLREAKWFEARFGVIRRRLIKEGYLKRAGKSFWVRVDAKDSGRVNTAFELLERIEQAGAEPVAADGYANEGSGGIQ